MHPRLLLPTLLAATLALSTTAAASPDAASGDSATRSSEQSSVVHASGEAGPEQAEQHSHADDFIITGPQTVPTLATLRADADAKLRQRVGGMSRAAARVAMATGSITYDIVVFAVKSKSGPVATDLAESRAVVEGMDRDFKTMTGDAYRFRFAEFAMLDPVEEYVCVEAIYSPSSQTYAQIQSYLGSRPDSGRPVLWVVVADVSPECGMQYAGIGNVGRPGIHMDARAWPRREPREPTPATSEYADDERNPGPLYFSKAFTHEVGHNLGLRHVAAFNSDSNFDDQRALEFGDPSDIMGIQSNAPVLGLQSQLQLGLVPAERMQIAAVSGIYRIAAPSSPAEIEPLIIPVANGWGYIVDYRRAVGSDWALRYSQGGFFVGRGVQIRQVNYDLTDAVRWSSALVPTEDDTRTQVAPSEEEKRNGIYRSIRMSWRDGESVTLGRGITVTVQETSDTTATIRVERPVDDQGPQLSVNPCNPRTPEATTSTCTFKAKRQKRMRVPVGAVQDATWTTDVELIVGDQSFVRELAAPASTFEEVKMHREDVTSAFIAPFTFSLSPGVHSLTARATDLLGNVTERSWDVTIKKKKRRR